MMIYLKQRKSLNITRTYTIIIATICFLLINYIYFKLIFGSFDDIIFCCDATTYIKQSKSMIDDGLFYELSFGYRSYFNYLFVGIIREIGSIIGFHKGAYNTSASYTAGALFWYALSGILCILRFAGKRKFKTVFIPFFLNPFIFSYVPYPLQEGQVALLFIPLSAWALLSYFEGKKYDVVVSTSLLIGIAWMLKVSYILIIIFPLIFLFIYILKMHKAGAHKIFISGLSIILILIPLAPQLLYNFKNTNSLSIYTYSSIMGKQLDTSKNLDDGTNMRSSVRTGQIRIVNKPESSGLAPRRLESVQGFLEVSNLF